jgi:hypothetical protein
MATRCLATTKDGNPCAAKPWRGDYCRWHSPQLAAQRREWSRRGGASRSNKARARKGLAGEALTMPEVSGLLSRALRKVEAGTMEPGVATAMATLARALVATQEAGVVEERLAALEERLGVQRKGAA